jgi:uncharacterized membrane protein
VIGRVWSWIRRHRDEEQGAVLIFTAIAMVAVLGAGAMGVDVGFTVYGSREAQAMADTAAADIIQYINNADQETSNPGVQSYLNTKLSGVLQDNNSNANLTVTPMLYSGGVYTVPAGGCKLPVPTPPTYPACNAVAVQATQAVPQPFWGGFNNLAGKSGSGLPPTGSGSSGCGLTTVTGCGIGCNGMSTPCFDCPVGGCATCPTTSCYTWLPQSTFSIGTYLASFDSQQVALLNDIFGNSLGTVGVTAVGYEGLANTDVTLNQLITASGGLLTTDNVLTASYSAAQWQAIWLAAVENQEGSLNCGAAPTPLQCNAATALGPSEMTLTSSSTTNVALCALVVVNGENCSVAGADAAANQPEITYSGLDASLNVLQMLTTEAELANGSSAVNVTSGLQISGVTGTLTTDVVGPAQIATGPVGSITSPATGCPPSSGTATCAETAQVSADLSLSILGVVGTVDIPLSAADGIATLTTMTCANTVNGAITSTKITSETTTATAAVTLAGAAVATLTLSGASASAQSYTASVVPPTASTASAGTNPRQVGTDDPTPTISGPTGLYTGLLSTLLGTWTPPLNTWTPGPLSDAIGPLLQAAGVTVGGADVADLGTDCDAIEIGS